MATSHCREILTAQPKQRKTSQIDPRALTVSWPSPEIVSWSLLVSRGVSKLGTTFRAPSPAGVAGRMPSLPAPPSDNPALLTVAELATLLRTTPQGIRSRLYRGQIPESAVLKTSAKGRVLFRRHVIERHFGLVSKGGAK